MISLLGDGSNNDQIKLIEFSLINFGILFKKSTNSFTFTSKQFVEYSIIIFIFVVSIYKFPTLFS